jgi:hypothetical protein
MNLTNAPNKERGSALVFAMLGILLMMTLIVGFSFNTRNQSVFNAGFKLNGVYNQAARSVIAEFTSNNLQSGWVEIPKAADYSEIEKWRFGQLLQESAPTGKYGKLMQEQVALTQGNLNMNYNLWVANNADDPAVMFQGVTIKGKSMTPEWDTDSKIVVTVEVFQAEDPVTPRATITSLLGPAGQDEGEGYYDAYNLGGSNPLHQGDIGKSGSGIDNLDSFR